MEAPIHSGVAEQREHVGQLYHAGVVVVRRENHDAKDVLGIDLAQGVRYVPEVLEVASGLLGVKCVLREGERWAAVARQSICASWASSGSSQ